MATDFAACCQIEKQSRRELAPLLKQLSANGLVQDVVGKDDQMFWGDVWITGPDGQRSSIEIKAEQSPRTGNLFLETWSNRGFERRKAGWMYTLHAATLLYYFLDNKTAYVMPFPELFFWFHGTGKVAGAKYRYPEKPVGCDQLNETIGACVPLRDIKAAIPVTEYVGRIDGGFCESVKPGTTVYYDDAPKPPSLFAEVF